jgi:hypothetical protein
VDAHSSLPAKRIVLGLLVAAVIPALLFAIFTPVSKVFDGGTVLGAFAVFFIFCVAITLLLAAPMFLALNRLDLVNGWSTLGVGVVIGGVVGLAVRFPNAPILRDVLLMVGTGVVAAGSFWLVLTGGRRRL